MLRALIRRRLHNLGIDIRQARHHPSLTDFLANRRVDIVLDVGANAGQFGLHARNNGYEGRIVSFEPVKGPFEQLAAIAKADGNWEAFNFAIGDAAGTASINVSAETQFSSFLKVAGAGQSYDEAASAVVTTQRVDVKTLDDVSRSLHGSLFIKVDTQGFEPQVLKGAAQVLKRAKGILMELPIINLYEGTWGFHEAVRQLREISFVPCQIHPVNHHPADRMALVEVDCLFRPHDPRID